MANRTTKSEKDPNTTLFGFNIPAAINRLRADLVGHLRHQGRMLSASEQEDEAVVAIQVLHEHPADWHVPANRKAHVLMELWNVHRRMQEPMIRYAQARSDSIGALIPIYNALLHRFQQWDARQELQAHELREAANRIERRPAEALPNDPGSPRERVETLRALANEVDEHRALTRQQAAFPLDPQHSAAAGRHRHDHVNECVWPTRLLWAVGTTLRGLQLLDPAHMHDINELHFTPGKTPHDTLGSMLARLRGSPVDSATPGWEAITWRECAYLLSGSERDTDRMMKAFDAFIRRHPDFFETTRTEPAEDTPRSAK